MWVALQNVLFYELSWNQKKQGLIDNNTDINNVKTSAYVTLCPVGFSFVLCIELLNGVIDA